MKHSSLESSYRDESNDGKIMFLRDIHGAKSSKTSTIRHFAIFLFAFTAPFYVLLNSGASNDRRDMKHSSLESSHRDKSNGGKIMFSRDIYGAELSKM